VKVTDRTRTVLRCARIRRKLKAEGWEEIDDRGGPLWELYRGGRIGHVITEVMIAPEGRSLFVKVSGGRIATTEIVAAGGPA
jgi:hypothetical protein